MDPSTSRFLKQEIVVTDLEQDICLIYHEAHICT